ncbi:MAG: sigma-70 family RNA polymerase sigma factor [Verrucomicrobiota bacterium]
MKNEQPNPNSEWVRSLVETHAADLTRYAASILGDDDAAKDVVQDSFVRLWREPREKVEDHVRPWLFRVCRSRALDLRRKGVRMSPLTDAQAAMRPAEGRGPEEAVERRDSHAQVMDFMQQLPENQREVVRLKFQNDLSYKEIATVTDLSVTNVGFLLHTALKTLRAQVTASGE